MRIENSLCVVKSGWLFWWVKVKMVEKFGCVIGSNDWLFWWVKVKMVEKFGCVVGSNDWLFW